MLRRPVLRRRVLSRRTFVLRRRVLQRGNALLSEYGAVLSRRDDLLWIVVLSGPNVLLSGPGDVLCHGFGMLRGGLLRREHSGERQRGLLRHCVLRRSEHLLQ